MGEFFEVPIELPQNSPLLPTLSKSFATLIHLKYKHFVNRALFSGLFTYPLPNRGI